jgi:hypothetical protein
MLTNNVRAIVLISVGLLLLGKIVFAVIVRDTVGFEQPIRAIHGRVSNHGNAIPSVWVDVYDNAQVCLDHSMTPAEKRKRQTRIASVKPKADGEFSIGHLPKEFYEVEFGNHGMRWANSQEMKTAYPGIAAALGSNPSDRATLVMTGDHWEYTK